MNISTQEHIDELHKKAKALKQLGRTDEQIVTALKEENGIEDFYARTILDNIDTDVSNKKSFWQLIIIAILCLAASAFIHFNAHFDGFRQGWIYWVLFWLPIIGAITFIARAFFVFKK